MQLLIDEVLSMTNQEWAEHYLRYCRLKEQGQIKSICGYSRKHLPEANVKTVYFKFRNLAKTGTADDVRVIKNLPALPGKEKTAMKPKLGDAGGFRGVSVEKNGFIFKIHDAGQVELLGTLLQSCMIKGVL